MSPGITYTTAQVIAPSATTFSVTNVSGYTGSVYFQFWLNGVRFTNSTPYSSPSSSISLNLSLFIGNGSPLSSVLGTFIGFYGWLEYSLNGTSYNGLGSPPWVVTPPPIGAQNTATFLVGTVACFLKGSQILCVVNDVETYLPVEDLKKGTLVKTVYGVKPLAYLGYSSVQNPGTSERSVDRLYKLSPSAYPKLTQDLFLTGGHSILVDTITDTERASLIKELGRIFVTDKKYRLNAYVDERAEPWASEGMYMVYHFALEHDNVNMNYGVYANGLLVETCTISYLTTKSNMTLL